MITLITGKKNQGKTKTITELFHKTPKGDGIVTKKIIKNKIFIGYELMHLSTGTNFPFISKKSFKPDFWIDFDEYGRFYFLKSGFSAGLTILNRCLSKNITPVFIDEIGPLELRGKGFAPVLPKILSKNIKNTDLFVTVREDLLEQFLSQFQIKDFKLTTII